MTASISRIRAPRCGAFHSLAVLASVYVVTAHAEPPALTLMADTNRDGVVDFESDAEGKNEWSPERGALFLFNNDDDDDSGQPDHADEIINGLADLADLAEVRLRHVPDFPDDVTVTLAINEEARDHVRVFHLTNGWENAPVVTSGTELDTGLIAEADLVFGIEGRSYAVPEWDGRVTLTVTATTEAGVERSDSIVLRVAPWIMMSNIDRAKTVYVREHVGRNEAMIADLHRLAPAMGVDLFVIPGDAPYPTNNIWLQDTMEIGYSQSRAGSYQNVVLPANRNKPLDNFPKDELLGPNYGWFQSGTYRPDFAAGGSGNQWLDWYGNLEVTPPLPGYPLGRVYFGRVDDGAQLNPEVVAMIDAQEVQGPALALDVSFLLIKHVDEVLAFIPSGDPDHPYRVLVPDTSEMLALAQQWQGEGLGGTQFLTNFPNYTTTVNAFLNNSASIAHNAGIQEKIDGNTELIKNEFGLRDEDIIRLPTWYNNQGQSIVPNMVNLAVVNGHLLVPAPNGPVRDGVDLLEQDFLSRIEGLPVVAHFLDDRQYHIWSGNVHCGTNVRRSPLVDPWWDVFGE